jgi:hypothetical protein
MGDIKELNIECQLSTPSSDDWDVARLAWNLATDLRPVGVAFPETASDVSRIVEFAGKNGLRVTAQGTGHGAASIGSLDNTILLKTGRMTGISVDPAAGTARVEAGVLARELGESLKGSGFYYLPGTSPDVSVTGYTLGGGMSWLGRNYGFACNQVSAIEAVTADGQLVHADHESNPDLFWALRGSGGCHAIVTALHFSLVPVSEVYAGALLFPAQLGAPALYAYRDWAATSPDEFMSIFRFLRPPDLPQVPEQLRNTPVITITGAFIGTPAEGERLLSPLLEIGTPIANTFQPMPPQGLTHINMDPENPVPVIGHHATVRELPDEAIDAFVAQVGPESGSPLLLAELRRLGGAFGRKPENAGALASLDADFIMYACGIPMNPELAQAVAARLDDVETALLPWAGTEGFMNFSERAVGMEKIYSSEVCSRLGEVKRRWDPDGVIVGKQELRLV